ncbi:MAG: SPFH domain-containing protein [Acidobacteriota bacterium]
MPKLMEVIDYLDESGDTLVARVPADDSCEVKWGAQLTVRESQAAVFFRDGKAVTAFRPGRYVLKTQNIPVLTKWVTSFGYGPRSPFRAEVYFVGTKLMHGLKWGTRQPIIFRDAELHAVRLRSFGTFSIKVVKPVLFLNRMAGTQGLFTTDEITDYLRSILTSRLMDVFGTVVKSVFDLPQYYDELAAALKARVADDFAAAGLELVDFLIEAITPPEEVQKMIDERSSMAAIGDMNTFMQFKAAKSLQDAAQNGGEMGGMLGAGAGLGFGMMMPQMMSQSFGMQPTAPQAAMPAGAAVPANTEAAAAAPPVADPFELLGKLKGLLDLGAITAEEYETKKADLLSRM